MRYVADLDEYEIGEVLGISRGNVARTLSDARQRVGELLIEDDTPNPTEEEPRLTSQPPHRHGLDAPHVRACPTRAPPSPNRTTRHRRRIVTTTGVMTVAVVLLVTLLPAAGNTDLGIQISAATTVPAPRFRARAVLGLEGESDLSWQHSERTDPPSGCSWFAALLCPLPGNRKQGCDHLCTGAVTLDFYRGATIGASLTFSPTETPSAGSISSNGSYTPPAVETTAIGYDWSSLASFRGHRTGW